MFFCNVSIAEKYNYLDEKFTVAYKWLAETDIKNLPEGFYPLMGDDVIAGVQEYSTSPWEERRFETHEKYFDIQYMVTGDEMFGVCKRDGLKEIDRIDENDVVFYSDPDLYGQVLLREGDALLDDVVPDVYHLRKVLVFVLNDRNAHYLTSFIISP